ncbi:hypothetical protein EDD18DRAFT_1383731 [Armillaria luteobubalina]|uniref:Uncharacterized protein n=1 Tax=Armillaria luteobubalina TaxID=153913 RepID=A0AA39Q6E9_9AGAR|nr:hypothetical protein EDD18DRAFT_1383731 [Armillaria luteobubalina]
MLSAVAARKAAQATKKKPEPTSPVLQDGAALVPGKPSQPISKQTPSSQSASAPSSRKNKNSGRQSEPSRYLEVPDTFHIQEEIIVIDPDTSDERDIEQPEPEDEVLVPISVPWPPPPPTISEETDTLSTFHPVLDQNTFILSSQGLCFFGMGEGAATLLALSLSDIIYFFGAYRLTFLQGSIKICGTTIHLSTCAYNVIRVKEAVKTVRLASRFQCLLGATDALVIIQELQANVSGLEVICRASDGVSSPFRRKMKMPLILVYKAFIW